jgi:hypothetical protein
MEPFASIPCPMILQPQWSQVGAMAWMAHSKLSKTWVSPPRVISSPSLAHLFAPRRSTRNSPSTRSGVSITSSWV